MAFVPLATTTTLAMFRSMVQLKTSTLSGQETGLLPAMWTDIIHEAVSTVREFLGSALDPKYSTQATVTEASNLIDISTTNIRDVDRIALYDATHGEVRIVSSEVFYGLRSLYDSAHMGDALFAHVVNTTATNEKLQIQTYRGYNTETPGTLTFLYYRNPVKAEADATKIDLPEERIPLAVDVAAVIVFKKLGKVAPIDLDPKLIGFLNVSKQK